VALVSLPSGTIGVMGNTALLVMDVQVAIVQRFQKSEAILTPLAKAIAAARAAGVPVIYVRLAFREGRPEVSRRNRVFAAIASGIALAESDPATQVHPAVAPQPGDVVVIKKRVSAFSGSDLDVVLRSLDVHSLVLTGIATSGVVLSTLRQAADLDYDLTVLADGCADGDSEVHRVLIEKVFSRQATVISTDEWIAGLSADS